MNLTTPDYSLSRRNNKNCINTYYIILHMVYFLSLKVTFMASIILVLSLRWLERSGYLLEVTQVIRGKGFKK